MGEPLFPRCDIPDLEVAPLPDEHHVFFQPGEFAQGGGDQDSPLSVGLELFGEADEQTLPPAGLLVEAGEGLNLGAYRLPGDAGVEKQAAIGVGGEDHRATSRLQGVPMPGRHCKPSLGVETQLCRPLKQRTPLWWRVDAPQFPTKTYFSPL